MRRRGSELLIKVKPLLYSIDQAAIILGISRDAVIDLIEQGQLRGLKAHIGKKSIIIRIPAEDLPEPSYTAQLRLEQIRPDDAEPPITHGNVYQELFALQHGRCAICGVASTRDKPLFIDHDHIEGYTRGLLCPNCNSGLGQFKDAIELLHNAIAYLQDPPFDAWNVTYQEMRTARGAMRTRKRAKRTKAS